MSSREMYFTAQTLSAQADAMRREAAPAHLRGEPFEPARAALLVLDLQYYFLDPDSHAFVPSAAAILPGVRALIDAFTLRGRPVVFTRHVNTPADAGRMAGWWRDLIDPASPLSAVALETGRHPVLDKTQYDAFHKTELESLLRERGVEQAVVTGVMTHLCCETTARAAFMRGFAVFFCVDGTATYTEAFHRASLVNLAHGFATLSLTAEILSALEAADGG